MALDSVVPFITKEGFEYLLKFTEFNAENLPIEIDIPIIDVTIEAIAEMNSYNNPGTLFSIANHINDYLAQNNVILYCYCSHEEILKNPKKTDWSNQKFRSLLFEMMFSRNSNSDIHINEKIIIEDPNGDHYIHLISKAGNEEYFNVISKTVLSLKP